MTDYIPVHYSWVKIPLESSSPTSLTGTVGKTLNDLNLRFEDIKDFESVQVDKEFFTLPERVVKGLSYDQKICYYHM